MILKKLDNVLFRDFLSLLLGFILGYIYIAINPSTVIVDNEKVKNDNVQNNILEENKIFKKKEKCYRDC